MAPWELSVRIPFTGATELLPAAVTEKTPRLKNSVYLHLLLTGRWTWRRGSCLDTLNLPTSCKYCCTGWLHMLQFACSCSCSNKHDNYVILLIFELCRQVDMAPWELIGLFQPPNLWKTLLHRLVSHVTKCMFMLMF
jgi:hypothetical protein